ncbi:hypothetical protein [Amycolatopsis sp. cmx-4-68]|uniref:hypothetical protein n=1 Tax=Amycolatopsis sp. cmx-4-68 TaxID=2790938 RepID=UPI00397DF6AF
MDEYVRVAEKRIERHEKARRVAERKLVKAQVPAPRSGEPDGADGLGKRIEKILEVAKTEAEEIRQQARKESEELLAAAEKTAADADSARAGTERAAQREAQLIISRAEHEAEIIRAAHEGTLAALGQIVEAVAELRERFGGDAEVDDPAEPDDAEPVTPLAG